MTRAHSYAVAIALLIGVGAGSFVGLIVIWASVSWSAMTFALLDAVSK